MPDHATPTTPAARDGRTPSRLYGPCGHGAGPCEASPTRPYPQGPRCAAHQPNPLANNPGIGKTAEEVTA